MKIDFGHWTLFVITGGPIVVFMILVALIQWVLDRSREDHE